MKEHAGQKTAEKARLMTEYIFGGVTQCRQTTAQLTHRIDGARDGEEALVGIKWSRVQQDASSVIRDFYS